ncbi:hypothetical protein SAMN05216228_1002294 [Rhizobium tibeticum]|uniref:Oligosaccharyl transferase-like protein n=1 Tax=Rhizobium tibeticum TaxID=501024 RepID=A0A1H8E4T2_9HYPH|nr:hypothetical protein [Rhizobium tibeticum]SEH55338.1 hypothetical protein RTCCBAU85039_1115 [Rhizobium tibeticum]SEN14124.1 hypothetical protein SAMN05216228_1002294 [Rhizobium tibeticum]
MTNVAQTVDVSTSPSSIAKLRALMSGLWPSVLLYSALLVAAILALKLPGATDYVGADNDDGMRLVEVRDFLSGQGWFDLMQYRMGLGEGTLMHWSRLIDLPIATLIRFFDFFLPHGRAEALALAVWPLSLTVPSLWAMGLAGRRVGGEFGMHVALGLTAFLLIPSNRFLPGAIDHHNVQFALVAIMAAMLLDEDHRALSYAAAGLAAATAIAIGVETTPLVAAVCIVVAVSWAWEGEPFAHAAKAFGLALALSISLFFVGTVPPRLYSAVTCDNLSLGYYSLAAIGGGLLLVAATFASRGRRLLRFVALGGIGALVLVSVITIAPQCLHNPLADLDPLLVKLWLDGVQEAQSILALNRQDPFTLGFYYATGVFALATCVFRLVYGDRVRVHLVLLFLLTVSWVIAAFQVRGTMFANLLAIPPLTLLIIDMRRISASDSDDVAAAFCYLSTVLMSVATVWGLAGGLIGMQVENGESILKAAPAKPSCSSKSSLAPLTDVPVGLVVAPSDVGVSILRFTENRILAAPYHRNQGGMLTEMHIGLSEPQEAEAFLKGAGVTVLAFCADNPQTRELAKIKPDGLYAQLAKGVVPAYLKPMPTPEGAPVRFFRYVPTGS